ncbi:hypothetical protein JCM19000A_41230 [Silvimonas sp. JCM 19000]
MVDMSVNISDVVFVKTSKGQQEINERTFGLASRLRRALILVDGQKAALALRDMLLGLDADALLIELQAQGFIEQRAATPKAAQPAVPAPVRGPATLQPAAPPTDRAPASEVVLEVEEVDIHDVVEPTAEAMIDPQMILQAQVLMVESANQFLGLMARQLILEIEGIKDAASLKRVIGRWNMSLRQSRKPPEQIDRYVLAVRTLVGI